MLMISVFFSLFVLPWLQEAPQLVEIENSAGAISRFTYLLFLYLIVALFIERLMEVLVSMVKYIDLKYNWHRHWNRQAWKVRDRLDRLYGLQGERAQEKKKMLDWILWRFVTEPNRPGKARIVSAETIRFNAYRLGSRVTAFIISLGFATWLYYNLTIDCSTFNCNDLNTATLASGRNVLRIDLVALFNIVGDLNVSNNQPWLNILITAALLSAGSEPLHQAIRGIEKIGESRKKKQHG
jgi:uncharacterized membrane protein (DUF106 family)